MRAELAVGLARTTCELRSVARACDGFTAVTPFVLAACASAVEVAATTMSVPRQAR
jgi:hypothetical protein